MYTWKRSWRRSWRRSWTREMEEELEEELGIPDLENVVYFAEIMPALQSEEAWCYQTLRLCMFERSRRRSWRRSWGRSWRRSWRRRYVVIRG